MGVRFLTFGGCKFLRLGVRFVTFGRYKFLRLGVKFLRLRVSNSYV